MIKQKVLMRSVTVLRATAVLLATGAGCWCAVGLAAPAALGLVAGPVTVEQAVTGTCGVLLLGCAGWLALVVTTGLLAALLDQLPQQGAVGLVARVLHRCTPAVVRGVVATTLGLTVAGGATAPALADTARPAPAALAGLALPDRVEGAGPVPSVRRAPSTPEPFLEPVVRSVVVRPGDSLWTIASHQLLRTATDAETAAAVGRLYAVNRPRIGPDPDLLVPGTPLVLPDLHAHHRKDRP